jgi:hypothetical protein
VQIFCDSLFYKPRALLRGHKEKAIVKISFCTTCKGRLHHLKRTLPQNLRDNPQAEFVVLDYSSEDGLKEWILSDPVTVEAMRDGRLIYARHPDAPHFRMAHAKNMAHRLATGDIVCNLDADNFTGRDFDRYLASRMGDKPQETIVYPHYGFLKNLPIERAGFCGRIAMSRDNFLEIGGYDEQFSHWGGDDHNIIARSLAHGLRPRPIEEARHLAIIAHDHAEREKNLEHRETVDIAKASKVTFATLKGHFQDAVGRVQANGGQFGQGKVLVGEEAKEIVLGPIVAAPSFRPTCLGTPLLLKTWLFARPRTAPPVI